MIKIEIFNTGQNFNKENFVPYILFIEIHQRKFNNLIIYKK